MVQKRTEHSTQIKFKKPSTIVFLSGGGEVVIPCGVFLTGGLRLRSGITLHLLEGAVSMGSICPEDDTTSINDSIEPISSEEANKPAATIVPGTSVGRSSFPYSRWNNAIIRAINARNISIVGEKGAEINGGLPPQLPQCVSVLLRQPCGNKANARQYCYSKLRIQ